MKTINEIQNLRMIKVSYLPPTNNRGSRIKIYETKRYRDEKTQSKVFGYDYSIDNVQEQANMILQKNGFNVISRASEYNNYVIMCNNWAEDFKNISELS